MFSTREILNLAVQIEINGEKNYREAVGEISVAELGNLLEWMADEEARHAKWFQDLQDSLGSADDNPLADEMNRHLFAEVIGNRSFSLQEVDFAIIRSTNQLIRLFIEFENDSILFYELIQPFIDGDEAREVLKRIILEEHRHIDRLKDFLGQDADVAVDQTGLV